MARRHILHPPRLLLFRLPQEALDMIFADVAVEDLKRFRLVNKWCAKKSFGSFFKRGFSTIRLEITNPDRTIDLSQVLDDNTAVAIAVKGLGLSCHERITFVHTTSSKRAKIATDQACATCCLTIFAPLFKALPALEHLGICRGKMTPRGCQDCLAQVLRHTVTLKPFIPRKLAALTLTSVDLSSVLLLSFLKTIGPQIPFLEFHNVNIGSIGRRDNRSEMHARLPSEFPQLAELRHTQKAESDGRRASPVGFFVAGTRDRISSMKRVDGQVQMTVVSQESVMLKGRQAVEYGCEVIQGLLAQKVGG